VNNYHVLFIDEVGDLTKKIFCFFG